MRACHRVCRRTVAVAPTGYAAAPTIRRAGAMTRIRAILQAIRDFVLDKSRRLVGVIRRHPLRSALMLPLLGVVYVLAG